MKSVVFCNTYYQLIFAVQMRLSLMMNDEVDIIISDQSKGAHIITEKLSKEGIFDNCYYVETKSLGRLNSVLDGIKGNHTFGFLKYKYDQLFVHNTDIISYALFSRLYTYNSKVRVSRFEEGILSYDRKGMDSIDKKKRMVRTIKHALGVPSIEDSIDYFYCFFPEVYAADLHVVEVPKIHPRDKICPILKRLFSLKETDLLEYSRKYIFFTSVYDFEGGSPIGEYELVCKVADLVGNENLIIKTHPRDTRTIYQESGFYVAKNASIPWEVIQILGDFSDKIFITATSGSVLAGSFMTEYPVKTLYAYKLCNIENNHAAALSARNIERILETPCLNKILNNVSIATKIEDIIS